MKSIKAVGFGIVVFLLVFGSLFVWQVWAQDDDTSGSSSTIYLPWIAVNHAQPEAADAAAPKPLVPTPWYPVHPDDQHWLENLQDLPYSETPYEGAPVLRPDPMFNPPGSELPPIESIKPPEIIYASGPETIGSKINILDREIQLPPDIYVEALIGTIECVSIELEDGTFFSFPCPKTPFLVLSTVSGDVDIRIEADGQVYAGAVGPEGLEGDRKKFQFVLDAFGTELKPDPTFEIPSRATPIPASAKQNGGK